MKTGTFIHGRQVFVGSVSIPIPPCPRTIDIRPQFGSGDNFLRGFIFHFQSILPQPARYSRDSFAEKVDQPIHFGALRLFFFVSVRRERRGERSKPDRTGPLAEAFPRHNRKNLHRIFSTPVQDIRKRYTVLFFFENFDRFLQFRFQLFFPQAQSQIRPRPFDDTAQKIRLPPQSVCHGIGIIHRDQDRINLIHQA